MAGLVFPTWADGRTGTIRTKMRPVLTTSDGFQILHDANQMEYVLLAHRCIN
jgi:hypothetical protein